jgi:hypothetical protein
VNSIVYARTAPPVNVVTGKVLPNTLFSGANSVQRPNVVPGVPLYLYGPYPGGKAINPAAFTMPVPATAQGNLSRNALRGFNATQVDFTLRRMFMSERFSLQSSADMFNIFNHPNSGSQFLPQVPSHWYSDILPPHCGQIRLRIDERMRTFNSPGNASMVIMFEVLPEIRRGQKRGSMTEVCRAGLCAL